MDQPVDDVNPQYFSSSFVGSIMVALAAEKEEDVRTDTPDGSGTDAFLVYVGMCRNRSWALSKIAVVKNVKFGNKPTKLKIDLWLAYTPPNDLISWIT